MENGPAMSVARHTSKVVVAGILTQLISTAPYEPLTVGPCSDILDTDQFNAIQNIVSARNLQVMTDAGLSLRVCGYLNEPPSGFVSPDGVYP